MEALRRYQTELYKLIHGQDKPAPPVPTPDEIQPGKPNAEVSDQTSEILPQIEGLSPADQMIYDRNTVQFCIDMYQGNDGASRSDHLAMINAKTAFREKYGFEWDEPGEIT